ncbi:MAG: sugar transferase [Thiothrix sp.]|nr:MAG: sugar transferase [Thiothrix sp.]
MSKRLFDFFFASLGLILLSPLFLLIAAWIRTDSVGPVFFRQERVGQFGKIFRIHKFRTMVTDAEKQGMQITVGNDVRITRPGSFLRRYKLDELPQLMDVVQGTMSLVGPRPEVPKYVKHYPDDIRDIVLSVKPGITDLASIDFKDENILLGKSSHPEETYIYEILPRKLNYCVQYVQNRSLLLDIKLILRTMYAII